MSTVLEPAVEGRLAPKNGDSGTGTARQLYVKPLGLNAQKVVAKRYSMKDENGEPIETWGDIVRRVVGHVAKAEGDPQARSTFYNDMTAVMLAPEPEASSTQDAGDPDHQRKQSHDELNRHWM